MAQAVVVQLSGQRLESQFEATTRGKKTPLPHAQSRKNGYKEKRGSKRKPKNGNDYKIAKIDKEVDIFWLSPEFENYDFTLLGLSQHYDPEMDIDLVNSLGDRVPVLSI